MTDDYNKVHGKRFAKSLEWIEPYAAKAVRILELGGRTQFSEMVDARWPGKLITHYPADLRDGFSHPDCDLILAMEIAEHLVDREDGIQDQWTGSAVKKVLQCCFDSLRSGGRLFLTSPNCVSRTSLNHILHGKPAMLYRPHHREFSPSELRELIAGVGFRVDQFATLDVWLNAISPDWHKRIVDLLAKHDLPVEDRGECCFVMASKP